MCALCEMKTLPPLKDRSEGEPIDPPPSQEMDAALNDALAGQLQYGFWQSNGSSARKMTVSAGNTISVNIEALDATGQGLALKALETWTDVMGVDFVRTSGTAQMRFDDANSGAYAQTSYSSSLGWTAFINIDDDWYWPTGSGYLDVHTYGLQTYIHEIGHALGLGHAGNYNGSANYGSDALYDNDSWQASVMSYFDQSENTDVSASFAYVVTPMIVDVIAIQNMYGVPENVNAGGTVHDIAATYAELDIQQSIAMTIVDSSGNDILDMSGLSAGIRLDLNDETVSDIQGLVGNFGIARGTIIERAIGTDQADEITGNEVNNRIEGGAGNDTINGGLGLDMLYGGDGDDFIFGGPGAGDKSDIIYAGGGADTVDGGAGNDQIYGMEGDDIIEGGDGADLIAGQDGDDTLSGSGLADEMFGGAGVDFLNGGFGFDRLNGGAGADTYFHVGVSGHGTDWIQDYASVDGDLLQIGITGASEVDFQVNYAATSGAGSEATDEAFVIYIPTGQILFALVDGGGQSSISLQAVGSSEIWDVA